MHKICNTVNLKSRMEFYTLVTRFDEYREMVKSAKRAGFDKNDIDFFYFDNKNSNDFDGYSGINHAIKFSKAEYIVFCHQDILFNYDGYEQLIRCIDELDNIDSKWVIAGNAGKTQDGKPIRKISDPHGINQTFGPFPSKVISVDENFILINNKYNLACTYQLNGFHLYGIDLCTNAINLGLKCYVIDFHLYHKSAGNIDRSFYESREKFIKVQYERLKRKFFSTTCTSFYVTNNIILNFILNSKIINSLLRRFIK